MDMTEIPTQLTRTRPPVPPLVYDKLRIKRVEIDASVLGQPVAAIARLQLYGVDENGIRVDADEPVRNIRIDDLFGLMEQNPNVATAMSAIFAIVASINAVKEQRIIDDMNKPAPEPTPEPAPEPAPEPTP